MSDQEVVYDLRLKDGLTGKVHTANEAVNGLESSLGSVKGLLEGIGIGLVAFKGAEFLHEANEAWDKMEFSMSQVQAALVSTGGAAGLTFDELKQGAEDAAHSIKFTQSEILDMQSILLTFPSVTKETFGQASTIIEDMSTRLGQDLKSSAIQVGKALQDPERGITALRRVGVNFNDTQVETIKHLVDTNHAAQAQALILKELAVEFGGSAAAAADADKGFRLDKTMEENKVALGELIDKIKEDMMPVLVSIANGFKNVIDWVKKNATWLKELGIAIGVAVVAFKTLTIVGPILTMVENALVAAATSGASFGAAMATALGPITLIAIAVGGLVYAFTKLRDSINEAHEARNAFLGVSVEKENTALEEMAKNYGGGSAGRDRASTEEKARLVADRDELRRKLAVETNDDRKKEINDAYTEVNAKINAVDRFQQGLIQPKKAATTPGATGTAAVKEPKTKATGSKSVTIHVSIAKLIGVETLKSTTIKESLSHIGDAVTKVLAGSINDAQVIVNNQ